MAQRWCGSVRRCTAVIDGTDIGGFTELGIFQKIGNWLSEKSDRFIRGDVEDEFEQEQGFEEEEEAAPAREPLDPFGRGEGEYGGRVPYRSKADLEREAQMKMQQAQQAMQQQQQMMQQQAYQQQPQQPYQQQGYPQQNMGQYQQSQAGYQQQNSYRQQPNGNVVQFPGMQNSPDGSVYAHVEYVVLLHSRQECKDVIAYIKSNASVFLNMEFIASDSERQRCVDMLSGAAYTLGCALNKISPRGIYLISSPSVRVVLDPAMQKFTAAPEPQAQGFAPQQPRRHRFEGEQPQQPQAQQPVYQQPEQENQQPTAGYFTSRFQAQSAQRPHSSFGSVMAGNATGRYQPVAPVSRYQGMQQ